MNEEINFDDVEFGEPIEEKEPSYRDGYIRGIYRAKNIIDSKQKEIERLKKDNEYLNKKHEKIIHNIMEFVDKNTFNHRNTGERILTLHGKGILDLFDICLGNDKE